MPLRLSISWWKSSKLEHFVGHLFNGKPNIDSFTITDFHELLTITVSGSLVSFDGEYYKQIGGVAMGSH